MPKPDRGLLVQNRDFSASCLGGPRMNITTRFRTEKLEWCGWPMVKNDDMITRFDTIHDRDRRIDGRTDERTDTA